MAERQKWATGEALADDVAFVAAPWIESSFYEDSEKWSYLFWNKQWPFLRFFERLDTRALVELSAGHGRQTAMAAARAGTLHALDVLAENIAVCKERFADKPNVTCLKIDGTSFQPLPDGSATGIFCYDSMVHFSPAIVASYLQDAMRVLAPGGRALFHHSNYPAPFGQHYGGNPGARNHMTQSLFILMAEAAGLTVEESVIIDWSGHKDLDCVTLLRKPEAAAA